MLKTTNIEADMMAKRREREYCDRALDWEGEYYRGTEMDYLDSGEVMGFDNYIIEMCCCDPDHRQRMETMERFRDLERSTDKYEYYENSYPGTRW